MRPFRFDPSGALTCDWVEWGAGGLELNGFRLAQVLAKVLAKLLAKVPAKTLAKVLAKVVAKGLAKLVASFVVNLSWRTIRYKLPTLFRVCVI